MVFNIQFQICGLIIMLAVCAMYFHRRAGWKLTDIIFAVFLAEVLCTILLDIASIFTINYRDRLPDVLNAAVCKTYLIGLTGGTAMSFLYLLSDVYQEWKLLLRKIFVYAVIYAGSVVLIAVAPIGYYVNVETKAIYTTGPAIYAAFAVCLLFIVLDAVYMLVKRREISHNRKLSVGLVIVCVSSAGCIEFVFQQLLVVAFAAALAMLFIYMFTGNAMEFVDAATGLYKKGALNTFLDKYYKQKTSFVVYLFSINDFDFMQKTFGAEQTNKLINEQAYFCRGLVHVHCFRFAHHQIALAARREYYSAADIKAIMDQHFAKPYIIADTPLRLNVSACLLEDSSAIRDGDEVVYLLEKYIQAAKEKKLTAFMLENDATMDKYRRQYEVDDVLVWALEHDKFQVYYQPIYSVRQKRYVSAEALIRLWDQNDRFISPDIFIPVAEKNGCILEIGDFVFEKVCKFISEHDIKEELGIEFIEINLSVVQCMQASLADELHKKMQEYNVSPDLIVFEITETSVIDSQAVMTQNMAELINRGSAFALDDYGSGNSNLNYVIQFPFNIVKFDKELVWAYFKSEKGRIGLEFAVNMVKHLKMKIIAEGVETKEQLDMLVGLGVDYIQGFYFSKPVEEMRFIECCQD